MSAPTEAIASPTAFDENVAVRRYSEELRAITSHSRYVWKQWWLTWKAVCELPPDSRYVALCSFCHSFRDIRGQWQELPPDVLAHLQPGSSVQVTHSFCPACLANVRVGPPEPEGAE